MSWTDEEIDKLFQEGAEGMTFEYQDAYWKEMEAQLPTKNSKGGLLWTTTGIVLGVLLLSGTFIPTKSQTTTFVAGNNVATAEFNSNVGTSTNATDVATQTTTQTSSSNEVSFNEGEGTERNERGEFVQSSTSTPKQSIKEPKGKVEQNKNSVLETTTQRKSEGITHQLITPTESGQKNGKGTTSRSLFNLPLTGEIATNDHVTIMSTASSKRNDLTSTPIESNVDALSTAELMEIKREDQSVEQSIAHIPGLKQGARGVLFLEVNAGLSQSLITPSDELSHSYSLGLGLDVKKGNWNVVGALYGKVSNHNDIFLTREEIYYGFGSEVVGYNLDYRQIYSLEGLLSVGRKFGRHELSIGIRPSLLLNTKVTQTDFNNSIESDSRDIYGYREGLKTWNLRPTLGYAFELSHKWKVGLNLGVLSTNAVYEEYVTGENNHLPIDGQVYIRRTLKLRK